jgi:hypothetical protein
MDTLPTTAHFKRKPVEADQVAASSFRISGSLELPNYLNSDSEVRGANNAQSCHGVLVVAPAGLFQDFKPSNENFINQQVNTGGLTMSVMTETS